MGLSNSKDPFKKMLPQKIKGKNICISQGWMGLFFLEQKENLLQISPVPHRSKFFNFLFQIVKWGNFAETLVYNTLCFTFASPEIQKNRVWPHCAVTSCTIYIVWNITCKLRSQTPWASDQGQSSNWPLSSAESQVAQPCKSSGRHWLYCPDLKRMVIIVLFWPWTLQTWVLWQEDNPVLGVVSNWQDLGLTWRSMVME